MLATTPHAACIVLADNLTALLTQSLHGFIKLFKAFTVVPVQSSSYTFSHRCFFVFSHVNLPRKSPASRESGHS
jgi:hypothetical protein